MAKKDIPFDLFFTHYYPKRVGGTGTAPQDFFETLAAVTLADLQALSDEELNCVPMGWLYDWLHCNEAKYPLATEYIEGIRHQRDAQTASLTQNQAIKDFINSRESFTADEAIQTIGISRERFLALMHSYFERGIIRYTNRKYMVNGLNR